MESIIINLINDLCHQKSQQNKIKRFLVLHAGSSIRVDLGVLISMLGPTFPSMPKQASLFGFEIPL